MKYYIIAGEASGDLHAANMMKALKKIDAKSEFRFWGGELMESVGGQLVKHYKDLAFMGFFEVVMNIRTISRNLKFCKADIKKFNPHCLIFIDYPGFNLRIAKWAKKEGIKTHYYISPQIWAWKESRINAIKRDIDKMYVILPFEKGYYEITHTMPVNFVGHPLIDAIADRNPTDEILFRQTHGLNQKPIIALLPGSRKQEISKMLSVMISVVKSFSDYQFVIAGAPSQDPMFYSPFIENKNVYLIENDTYDLLSVAHAAVVTSGTATLETALFKVPEVVCYKTSWISYEIGKRLVKLKYISLVNLILDKEVVTELIQGAFNTKQLTKELNSILSGKRREEQFMAYHELETKLGGQGASFKVAELIYDSLK